MAAILMLAALGETLNLMTLGGLALAVGILVDQAIVTIENIERHLHWASRCRRHHRRRRRDRRAGLRGHAVHLHRVRADVLPLGVALPVRAAGRGGGVCHAASYLLSRTLVPTLVMLLMGSHGQVDSTRACCSAVPRLRQPLRAAARLYAGAVLAAGAPPPLLAGLSGVLPAVLPALSLLGRDLFPNVDGGQIRLHMRMPTGTRIEDTARAADGSSAHPQPHPRRELETILDNMGVPNSGINLSYSNAGTIGTLDGEC
jgi:multidrug efflux pump subunit AcrB